MDPRRAGFLLAGVYLTSIACGAATLGLYNFAKSQRWTTGIHEQAHCEIAFSNGKNTTCHAFFAHPSDIEDKGWSGAVALGLSDIEILWHHIQIKALMILISASIAVPWTILLTGSVIWIGRWWAANR